MTDHANQPEQYQDAVGLGAIITTRDAGEITVSCGPLEPVHGDGYVIRGGLGEGAGIDTCFQSGYAV